MSAQPAAGGVRWMEMLKNGLGAPLVVLALLAMIVVPLAPPVLDALFSFNIAISLVVLLAVIYVKRPLDFTIFPIILLMTTMLRLALNVASTRVILLNGQNGHDAAGKVIAAFGEFVVGGNYAVGIVVFAILTIINFVVITKGAGRIAEVGDGEDRDARLSGGRVEHLRDVERHPAQPRLKAGRGQQVVERHREREAILLRDERLHLEDADARDRWLAHMRAGVDALSRRCHFFFTRAL